MRREERCEVHKILARNNVDVVTANKIVRALEVKGFRGKRPVKILEYREGGEHGHTRAAICPCCGENLMYEVSSYCPRCGSKIVGFTYAGEYDEHKYY